MGQQIFHRREEEAVVGGAGQHDLSAAEGFGDGIGHIGAGQVHLHYLCALCTQLFCHEVGCCTGVAVDGSTCHKDLFRLLGLVAGPDVVVVQVLAQISGQHRAVQRANGLDVQSRGLFQQRLHLRAVFPHDVQVVAAGFAGPVGLFVKLCHSAKAAKAIRGEQHLFGGFIADHDLRPVHHGGKHKGQGMCTERKALAVLHHYTALLGNGISAKELLHIQKGLGVAHHLHLRVECRQLCNVGTVVRLHVGDYQIIRLTACQSFGQVFQPRLGSAGIHRIQNGGLFVQNDIGIIAHAGGHRILALEQVNGGIIHAHTQNGFTDLLHAHSFPSPFYDMPQNAAIISKNISYYSTLL